MGVLTVVGLTGPASALDDKKPVPCSGAFDFKDPAGDNVATTVPTPGKGTDMIGGFLKYDPAKGDEASTYNLVVKDLDTTVPPGYATISWIGYYTAADKVSRWVRLISDFSGALTYEYGHIEDAEATTVSLYEGKTPGKVFLGADGVVQLVIPKATVKPGEKLTPLYGNVLQGQTNVPPQTGAPTRGSSWVMDRAPDTEGAANKSGTLTACAPAAGSGEPTPTPTPEPTATPAPPVSDPGSGPAPGGSAPPPSSGPTQTKALPVRLLTTSVKVKKVKKTLKLKLKSTEKVTNLSAQLSLGNKPVAKGKLATLSGAGTLSLKLKKKLKKGKYTLLLAGDTASGRLTGAYRLTVK